MKLALVAFVVLALLGATAIAPSVLGGAPTQNSAAGSGSSNPAAPPIPTGPGAVEAAVAEMYPTLSAQIQSAPASVWEAAYSSILTGKLTDPQFLPADLGSTVLTYGGIAAAGCLIAGALSAGIGCVGVIAAVGLCALFQYLSGNDAAKLLAAESLAWAKAMLAEAGNLWNASTTGLANEINALNLTATALSYETSNAALLQLSNTSFNVPLDLVQAGIPSQLATVGYTIEQDLQSTTSSLINWFNAEEGPNGEYSASPECLNSCASFALPLGASFYPALADGSGQTSASTSYVWWVQSGTLVAFDNSCYTGQTGATVTFTPDNGGTKTYSYVLTCQNPTNFTGPSGPYEISTTVAGGQVLLGSAMPLTTGAAGSSQIAGIVENANANGAPMIYLDGQVEAGMEWSLAAGGYFYEPCTASAPVTTGEEACANVYTYLWNLEKGAGLVAQTYWTFLQNLGYTSVSQIPANCVVPGPDLALPPNLSPSVLSNMTVGSLLSLYYGYLASLGHFYGANDTLSGTDFCDQHHDRVWTTNYGPWLNANINATGYLYEPGAAGETFATPSTWAYSGQLYLMPTVAAEKVTVGSTWEFPTNDPNVVLVNTAPGSNKTTYQYLSYITGNSTLGGTIGQVVAGGLHPAATNTTPGWAVYLTTCFVNGVPQATCTFSFSTINDTAYNVTCFGGQGDCTSQHLPTGGFFGGLGSVCSWWGISTLCSLFGGGLVSGIVSLLLLIILAVVVIGVVSWALGGKRRGGGGGTQTVVVEGGRR